jgi:hypothetical protein
MSETSPEPVARLEELLQAVEVLRELAEVAKEVQAEIERARREESS